MDINYKWKKKKKTKIITVLTVYRFNILEKITDFVKMCLRAFADSPKKTGSAHVVRVFSQIPRRCRLFRYGPRTRFFRIQR